MRINKWLGLGAGWIFAGPVGGIIGLAIGAILDGNVQVKTNATGRTTINDFAMSLIVLIAAVMKADGVIMKSELDYVKNFLNKTFGEQAAAELTIMLRDVLKQEIAIDEVCNQIGNHLDYSSKLEMIHLLFGVSNADGVIHPSEVSLIEQIAAKLGVMSSDFKSIKAMFVEETDSAYKTLGLEKTATVDEIKKAYKRLAIEHHPDKVSYLGEEVQNSAKEKFQMLNEAYEKIKKEKGFV
jgi:DnaJ like chaperone protein